MGQRGPQPTAFYYTYEDLVKLTGKSIVGVRNDYYREYYDPESLESVLLYLAGNATQEFRLKINEAVINKKAGRVAPRYGKPKKKKAKA